MKNIIFTLLLAVMQLANVYGASPKIEAQYVEGEGNLDGVLDEEVWSKATKEGSDMLQYEPRQDVPMSQKTEFMVA